MAKHDIYLGPDTANLDLLTPFGRKFSVNEILLERSERTASGKLVRDIISKKKEFTLNYSMIDGDELDLIISKYNLDSELILRVYNSVSAYDDYITLMSPFNKERFVLVGNGIWSNVQIVLVEV